MLNIQTLGRLTDGRLTPAETHLPLWRRWVRRSRMRLELAELDEHRLRDLGLTREAALAEARKPFWR